ncbi:hypothetical protein ACJX0J_035566 [Zea mays]
MHKAIAFLLVRYSIYVSRIYNVITCSVSAPYSLIITVLLGPCYPVLPHKCLGVWFTSHAALEAIFNLTTLKTNMHFAISISLELHIITLEIKVFLSINVH